MQSNDHLLPEEPKVDFPGKRFRFYGQQWETLYQKGYGQMGVGIGAKNLHESFNGIRNATRIVWSDDKKAQLDHSRRQSSRWRQSLNDRFPDGTSSAKHTERISNLAQCRRPITDLQGKPLFAARSNSEGRVPEQGMIEFPANSPAS